MKPNTNSPFFQTFECENPDCKLRFPSDLSISKFEHCPRCGRPMALAVLPYTNFLRQPPDKLTTGFKLSLILDNLRSAQNVGSIFRTANGAGVSHVYCCGTTPTPDHKGVTKASLGAEGFTAWSYHPNTLALARTLIPSGSSLIALESTETSTPLFSLNIFSTQPKEFTLILGNEISGIDPELLNLSHQVVHIPMKGSKTSINVAVAAGIGLYWFVYQINQIQ